jgi:hypothetical protein
MGGMRGFWVLVALCACSDPADKPDAAVDSIVVDEATANLMPQTLAESGLCADAGCTQINSGIYAFTPRYQLYSDTATKRRWIYLPPGTTIDTTDMEHWSFPVGTKLWKEFTRGTTRVETRLIMRVANAGTAADWYYAPYVWNASQDATTLAEFGEQDANGTQHDVPGKILCKQCHDNVKPSRVLGFSALQLDYTNADSSELDLADLVAMNLLSSPPSGSAPYFPLATDTTGTVFPALGYLHANCSHCHNPTSSVYAVTQIHMRLPLANLGDIATTPAYTTLVGKTTANLFNGHNTLVKKGDPSMSVVIDRFEAPAAGRMPAAGTEFMDTVGDTTLRNWITAIPP